MTGEPYSAPDGGDPQYSDEWDAFQQKFLDFKTGEWLTWQQLQQAVESRLSDDSIKEHHRKQRSATDSDATVVDLAAGEEVTWTELEHRVTPTIEISRAGSALDLPQSVLDTAGDIFHRFTDEERGDSLSVEVVAAASLYTACRTEGVARSLEEIAAVSHVDRKMLGKTFRRITRELGIEPSPVDPKAFIPRFASELSLSEEVRSKAAEIIDVSRQHDMYTGKSPSGFAAAAIYAASLLCDEERPQSEVADIAHVDEGTLQNHIQEQIKAME